MLKRLIALGGSLLALNAFAVNLQKFHFSNSAGFATLEDGLLTDGYITTDYKYILVSSYNYVRAPFIEVDGNNRTKTIIEWMHTLNFGGAYKFNQNFQVGFSSFATYQEAQGVDETEFEKNFSLGDSTVDFKYKFYEKNRFAISFTPKVYLPSGNKDYYLSNEEVGYYAGFAFDKAFKYIQLIANLGHKENSGARLGEVDHRRQFHFSLGALVPFTENIDITAEFFRDTPYDANNEQIPSEGNVGFRYNYQKDMAIFAGVGTGSLEETESTDMRMYAGLKYFPRAEKKTGKIAKEEDQFGKFYKLHNLYFATGSAKIDKISEIYLMEMIDHIKDDPFISKIVLEGYASQLGNKERNKVLSERRSKATKAYLISKGIAEDKLEIVGYGDEFADKTVIDKDSDRKVMLRVYRSR